MEGQVVERFVLAPGKSGHRLLWTLGLYQPGSPPRLAVRMSSPLPELVGASKVRGLGDVIAVRDVDLYSGEDARRAMERTLIAWLAKQEDLPPFPPSRLSEDHRRAELAVGLTGLFRMTGRAAPQEFLSGEREDYTLRLMAFVRLTEEITGKMAVRPHGLDASHPGTRHDAEIAYRRNALDVFREHTHRAAYYLGVGEEAVVGMRLTREEAKGAVARLARETAAWERLRPPSHLPAFSHWERARADFAAAMPLARNAERLAGLGSLHAAQEVLNRLAEVRPDRSSERAALDALLRQGLGAGSPDALRPRRAPQSATERMTAIFEGVTVTVPRVAFEKLREEFGKGEHAASLAAVMLSGNRALAAKLFVLSPLNPDARGNRANFGRIFGALQLPKTETALLDLFHDAPLPGHYKGIERSKGPMVDIGHHDARRLRVAASAAARVSPVHPVVLDAAEGLLRVSVNVEDIALRLVLRANVRRAGRAVLYGKELAAALTPKGRHGDETLTLDDDTLQNVRGTHRLARNALLQLVPIYQDLPEARGPDLLRLPDEDGLLPLLQAVEHAQSDDLTRPHIASVHLQVHSGDGSVLAEATDGHRLMRVSGRVPFGSNRGGEVLLSSATSSLLRGLLADGERGVTAARTASTDAEPIRVTFRGGDWTLTSAAPPMAYPTLDTVIPKDAVALVRASSSEWLKALDRLPRGPKGEGVIVSARGITQDTEGKPQSTERLPGKALVSLPAFRVNRRYLREVMEAAGAYYGTTLPLVLSGSNDPKYASLEPIVFSARGIPFAVVMPMRL
ncbi:MAG: hypothetical protein JNK72_25065 [Myxococcales bacterium]|nr:hypothetical protein [Myxococcales bacterium]